MLWQNSRRVHLQKTPDNRLKNSRPGLRRVDREKAGDWLLDKGITRIMHSPFHRAEQTARIVADNMRLPMTLADGLREMSLKD